MSKDIKATSIVKHKQIDVENVKAIMHKEYQFLKKVKEWNEKAHMMKREAKKMAK
jgi:hypothetical protein